MILTRPDDVVRLLRRARRVAVLGASTHASRAGHYVPRYLHGQGYEIHPVNPVHAGQWLFGREVVASLADLSVAVDVVDVFRRADRLPSHLDELLALRPRPGAVWLQSGIRDDRFARALSEAGIDVVQDRCMLADHQRLVVG